MISREVSVSRIYRKDIDVCHACSQGAPSTEAIGGRCSGKHRLNGLGNFERFSERIPRCLPGTNPTPPTQLTDIVMLGESGGSLQLTPRSTGQNAADASCSIILRVTALGDLLVDSANDATGFHDACIRVQVPRVPDRKARYCTAEHRICLEAVRREHGGVCSSMRAHLTVCGQVFTAALA